MVYRHRNGQTHSHLDPSSKLIIDTQTLLDRPSDSESKAIAAEATKAAKHGAVAGDILGIVYLMDRYQHLMEGKQPSLQRAIHALSVLTKGMSYGDGSKVSTRKPSLWNYWDEFKNVAHLWGAARLIQHRFGDEDLLESMSTSEGLVRFLGLAGALGEFGCEFRPSHRRRPEPLLSKHGLWKISALIPKWDPIFDAPPTLLLGAIASYKAEAAPMFR